MTDLRLERRFRTTPERLFALISQRANLLTWWGPEGMHVPEDDLDFTRTGPWMSVMQNAEGGRDKVSGQVTHVDPPNSVGFTWGWHDDKDARGAESHVTLTVLPDGDHTRLVLDHRELGDDEIAQNHEQGWSSSLNKLESLAAD
ncbi:SRPBCC family protein [Aliiroseovarius sp.]|uniref:SRPBCC family protein n=1 Tax=Aliiroseovarius sp. TaxID=1872442 RepID=UPI003BAA2C1C